MSPDCHLGNLKVMVMLAFFHLLFVMLVWSFFQAMTTDPGQVPVFWVSIKKLEWSLIGIDYRDSIWAMPKIKGEGIV